MVRVAQDPVELGAAVAQEQTPRGGVRDRGQVEVGEEHLVRAPAGGHDAEGAVGCRDLQGLQAGDVQTAVTEDDLAALGSVDGVACRAAHDDVEAGAALDEVHTADNGAEALDMARRERPDLAERISHVVTLGSPHTGTDAIILPGLRLPEGPAAPRSGRG